MRDFLFINVFREYVLHSIYLGYNVPTSSKQYFTLRLPRPPIFFALVLTTCKNIYSFIAICYMILGQWTGKILLRLYSSSHGTTVFRTRLFLPSSSSQVPPTKGLERSLQLRLCHLTPYEIAPLYSCFARRPGMQIKDVDQIDSDHKL